MKAVAQRTDHGANRKEVISFIKKIPPGGSDVLAERIKSDCTIEEIRVRFYPGQQQSLQVKPFIEHKGHKLENPLTYVETGDTFLSGDDDYFTFPVVIGAEYDDFMKVAVTNIDPTNTYTLAVFVVVDYYAGQDRVVGGVM